MSTTAAKIFPFFQRSSAYEHHSHLQSISEKQPNDENATDNEASKLPIRELEGSFTSTEHIELSPNGNLLALDNTQTHSITLIDTSSGKSMVTMEEPGHKAMIKAMSFSSDSKTLITASDDHQIIVWNCQQGSILQLISLSTILSKGDFIQYIFITSDLTKIFIGTNHQVIIQYDILTKFHKILFSSTSVSSTATNSVSISNKNQPQPSESDINSHYLMVFTTNESKLVISNATHALYVYDITSSQAYFSTIDLISSPISLAIAKNDRKAWLLTADGDIRTWDLTNCSLTRVYHIDETAKTIHLTSNGYLLYVLCEKYVDVLDAITFERLRMITNQIEDGCQFLLPSNATKEIIIKSTKDITIIDNTIIERRIIPTNIIKEKDNEIKFPFVITNNEENYIYYSPKHGLIQKNIDTNEINYTFYQKNEIKIRSYSVYGDNLLIGDEKGGIQHWKITTKTLLHQYQIEKNPCAITHVTISEDELMIAAYDAKNRLYLWDFHGNKAPNQQCYEHILIKSKNLIFTPDGESLIYGNERNVVIWDCHTHLTLELPGHEDIVRLLQITSDGKKIISASKDKTMKVWNLEMEIPELFSFTAHQGYVKCFCLSSNDEFIVSMDTENNLFIWDIHDGTKLCQITNYLSEKDNLHFHSIQTIRQDSILLLGSSQSEDFYQHHCLHLDKNLNLLKFPSQHWSLRQLTDVFITDRDQAIQSSEYDWSFYQHPVIRELLFRIDQPVQYNYDNLLHNAMVIETPNIQDFFRLIFEIAPHSAFLPSNSFPFVSKFLIGNQNSNNNNNSISLLAHATANNMPATINAILDLYIRALTIGFVPEKEEDESNNDSKDGVDSDIKGKNSVEEHPWLRLNAFLGDEIPKEEQLAEHFPDQISIQELCEVAEDYPLLFLSFASQLIPVQSYLITLGDSHSRVMENDYVIRGSQARVEENFWVHPLTPIPDSKSQRQRKEIGGGLPVPVSPYIIPIQDIASIDSEFLKSIVHSVEMSQDKTIFNNMVVRMILEFKWETFIQQRFYFSFGLHVFMCIIFLMHALIFDHYREATSSIYYFAFGILLLILIILCTCYFINHEALQFYVLYRDLRNELYSPDRPNDKTLEEEFILYTQTNKNNVKGLLKKKNSMLNLNLNLPNIPNIPTMSNIPDINLPNIPNMPNIPNLPDMGNIANIPTIKLMPQDMIKIDKPTYDFQSIYQACLLYFSDHWNKLHFLTNSLIIITIIRHFMLLHSHFHENFTSIIAAITLPLLALETLFFLGGLPSTGPLVRMVLNITAGIFSFNVILVVVLISFAGSFMILFQGQPNLQLDFDGYTSYDRALMTVYGFLFGSYNLTDFYQSKSPGLAIFLLYIFLFFVVIVLLNLLIAIMGDKYAEVQENAQAEAIYALAKLVLEYEDIIPRATKERNAEVWYPKWIQILQKADIDEEEGSKESSVVGKIKHLRDSIHKLSQTQQIHSNNQTKEIKSLLTHQKNLTKEIEHLQEENGSLHQKLDVLITMMKLSNPELYEHANKQVGNNGKISGNVSVFSDRQDSIVSNTRSIARKSLLLGNNSMKINK